MRTAVWGCDGSVKGQMIGVVVYNANCMILTMLFHLHATISSLQYPNVGGVYCCDTGDMHISCNSCIVYMICIHSSERVLIQIFLLLSVSKNYSDITIIM